MAMRQLTATTTAQVLLDYNPHRTAWTVKNYSGGTTFLSNDQVSVTSTGFPLAVGDFASRILRDGDEPADAVFVQMSAGTTDLRIVEEFGPRETPESRTGYKA